MWWVLLLLGCKAEPLRYEDRMSAWLEFAATGDLDYHMNFAGENKLNVNIAIQEGHHDRSFLQDACDAADSYDVSLRLWPILQEEDGYWPNQGNSAEFRLWVDQLLEWSKKDCRRLEGIAVDMEMPYDRMQTWIGLQNAEEPDIVAMATFFVDGIDEEAFERARTDFSELADELHELDLSCYLTGLPMLVDDALDGDEDIALALWTPIEEVDWDAMSFQVYRSMFQSFYGDDDTVFTPGLITSYADDIVTLYGERGALDLGTTVEGVISADGFEDPDDLQADISAALAASVSVDRITLYSLEGVDERGDAAFWVQIPDAVEAPEDDATAEVRGLITAMDALMNAR